jgi:hypothetical protein
MPFSNPFHEWVIHLLLTRERQSREVSLIDIMRSTDDIALSDVRELEKMGLITVLEGSLNDPVTGREKIVLTNAGRKCVTSH